MTTSTTPDAVPTSVYRYFDSVDRLIYVGITSRGLRRQVEHNDHAEWWHFVTRQEVEHLPSRAAARRREADLIREHRPPFNTQHNDMWQLIRQTYVALVVAEQRLSLLQEGIPLAATECGHCTTCQMREEYPATRWAPCRRQTGHSPDVREDRCPWCRQTDCLYLDGLADGREAGWREGHALGSAEVAGKVGTHGA